MNLRALRGGLQLLDGLICLLHEQGASHGGLVVHQEDLHGEVSVHITLQEGFVYAKRESVPLRSLDEELEGLEG